MSHASAYDFYHGTDHGERYEFEFKAMQLDEPRPPLSPHMLIQEMVPSAFWVMVSSLMMVRTGRRQGHEATWDLLLRYDGPTGLAMAKQSDVKRIIEPAGLANRRSKQLITVARQWHMGIRPWPVKDFMGEPVTPDGVGPYVTNAFRLFVHGETRLAVQDGHLRRFMVWAHARRRAGLQWRYEYDED